jgi:iron complex transport system ATP-binding protein
MFRAENISYSYPESGKGVFDVSFDLDAGKILAVLGSNGSGKTTLLNLLSRNFSPNSGRIFIDETNIGDFSVSRLSKDIAVVSQFFNVSSFSVRDFIGLGLVWQFDSFQLTHDKEQKERIEEIMEITGLSALANQPTNKISGGERQIAKIAQSLVKKPKILLLDEPVSHLDLSNSTKVLSLIKDVCRKENACAVVILHDIYSVRQFADFVLMLKNGRRFGYCKSEDFSDENVSELFSVKFTLERN